MKRFREDQGVKGRDYILELVKEERAKKREWREAETRRIKDGESQEDEDRKEEEKIQTVKR